MRGPSASIDRPMLAAKPHQVGRGRIGEAAELVEVPAAAEAGTLAPQDDLGDGGVGGGERQPFEETVAQGPF